MSKALLVIAALFVGLMLGYQLSPKLEVTTTSTLPSLNSGFTSTLAPTAEKSPLLVRDEARAKSTDDLVKLLSTETPKTQYEGYRAFQKLDQLSPDELHKILLSLDDAQAQLKSQIAWFFAGKFPEEAFLVMLTSMGDNPASLSQLLFTNLSANHPQLVHEWVAQNENDFAFLFPISEQQLERKLFLLQTLSVFPESKWLAYEEGLRLVKDSVRPQDKWSTIGLAHTVAQANPLEAIDYALAQHQGTVDGNLLNSALSLYAGTNPIEAKRLLLENQAHVEYPAISSLIDSFFKRGQFPEAYELLDTLTDKQAIEAVAVNTASKIHSFGSEKVTEFIAVIKDPALKVKAVSAATTSMSAAGYPVETVLAVMDTGLRSVAPTEKAFGYAWTLKNGYKDDPQSMASYLNRLRFNDKALADEVEKILDHLKDS